MQDIKLTEEQKQEVYNFLKDDIINDERIQPYLQIARIVGSENSDDNYTDTNVKGLLTYYKYELYNAIMKDPKNSLKEITLGLIKNDYPILMFNIDEWLYENMELIENEDAIKELVKTFYLIHKYKGTLFSDDVLQYFKDIEDIVNVEKPQIKEDTKDPLEMSKLNKWYQIQLYNLLIPDIFRKYLKGFPYNESEIKERAIRCFKDNDFRLSLYYTLLQAGETKEKIIDFIYNSFTNCISHSDTLYKFRSYLNLHVLDMSKKHNIDINLTYGEQEKIDKKIQDIKEFIYSLDTQIYKYGDLMDNFFKISDIYNYLSFDENGTKEKLQNSDKKVTKTAQKKPKRDIQKDNFLNQDEQVPISKLRNHSLKHKNTQERDYIMMSSTKQGNDLINGITSYASYNENIYSIQKRIQELESKEHKDALDTDQINFLKEKYKNKLTTKEELEKEENELLKNKQEIREKIKELDNREDITYLEGLSKQIDKRVKEIKEQKNNKALVVQQSLFNNEIEYKGKYITTSINIDDFDLSKFTDEGLTILLYMVDQIITNPNITDLTFDIDFIFNKMNNYKHNKKSVVRNEIKNLTDILYNMNIRIVKEDRLNNLEIGKELRVITGRQWTKDKKIITDDNGLKSMTVTLNDDFKKMILNSKIVTTKLGDTKQINNLQYFKIPLDLVTFKNKRARSLGLYILQQEKLNKKNMKNGQTLKRKMKDLYFNDYLKLKYNKKQGQFKKDIVYKLESYLNHLEDNKIILYNTDAFDKLRYDLNNKSIEEQKKIFDNEIIEIRVIPQIIDNEEK